MDTEIWVALIGLVGVVFASVVGVFAKKIRSLNKAHEEKIEHMARLAEEESKRKDRQLFHAQVTSPFYPIKEWTAFVHRIDNLCKKTEVDRVLVLVAVNGADSPTHASVIWEYRQTGPQFNYIDVPLDQDYVERLSQTKRGRLLRFKTQDAQNTIIGGFYSAEGVTESIWAMIGQRVSSSTGQVAYKYCSVATHKDNGFSHPDRIEREVLNLVGEYRGMIHVSGFVSI